MTWSWRISGEYHDECKYAPLTQVEGSSNLFDTADILAQGIQLWLNEGWEVT